MSTKTIDRRCGNCGSLVADPSQDPPQGCWEEVPGSEPEWVEVDDDMLENHRCDFWIPKETTDDAEDMDQEGDTDHQNDDLGDGTHDGESGSGQTTGAADSDETDSTADEASEQTDESQVDAEQSAAAEGKAAANSEPLVVDDTGTAPSYDELLQEVLSLRKQAEQDDIYKKRLAEIRSQISDAKDSKSRWDKKIKVLQELGRFDEIL